MVLEFGKFLRIRSNLPTIPDIRLLQDPMTSSSTTWLSSSMATEDAGHRLAIEEAMASGEKSLELGAHATTCSLGATEAAPPEATREAA